MRQALKQARLAYAHNEVPIGAVVVSSDGHVISRFYNQIEQCKTQSAHAEMHALRFAGEQLGSWRLSGCWLYVTLEPCAMCMHMIRLSRISGVIFGASSPLFGYHLDNTNGFQVYKKDAICVVKGICEDEARKLLRTFFKEKRRSMKWEQNNGT